MSAPAPPALPAMDSSIGAFMVGTILSVFLAGLTSLQAYNYFVNFGKSDKKFLVGLVTFLLICDVFHTAISCYTVYLWTVTHYADPSVLIKSPWSFTWDPFLCGIVAIAVQLFYAWRVFVVSRRKWLLPVLIAVLAVLSCAFAVGSTWKIYLLNSEFARFGEFRYGVAIWLLSAALADVLITASLVWYLRKASSGDYQRSSSIVQRIIRNTVETNGLTCLFAIVDAILFIAIPSASWHVIPNLSLVKLYFNGALVSLNSRKFHQQSLSGGQNFANSSVYTDSHSHGIPSTPAPKYSPGLNALASSSSGSQGAGSVITPSTLGEAYGSCAGAQEKAGGYGLFGGRKASARGTAAQGVQVTTTCSETITRVSSRDEVDLEKGLDPETAQAFELGSVPSSRGGPVDVEVVHVALPPLPPIPHAYTASATPDLGPEMGQAQAQMPASHSAHSTGMGGAIPREWA
ncbi:hypothetical protein JCM10207_006821 [Rhodosporidiobolus poonsookiae]